VLVLLLVLVLRIPEDFLGPEYEYEYEYEHQIGRSRLAD
jgi:hypothetical protein